jgi:hypothetical protein
MRTIVSLAALLASLPLQAQVAFERIVNAEREPQNWLSYSGTVDNQRYSRLDQINTRTVGQLELQWVWQARSLEKFEATALVVDGILYTVQAPNDVVALDAATGRVFWTYHHEPAPEGRVVQGHRVAGAVHGIRLAGEREVALLHALGAPGHLVDQRRPVEPLDANPVDVADDEVGVQGVLVVEGLGPGVGHAQGHHQRTAEPGADLGTIFPELNLRRLP